MIVLYKRKIGAEIPSSKVLEQRQYFSSTSLSDVASLGSIPASGRHIITMCVCLGLARTYLPWSPVGNKVPIYVRESASGYVGRNGLEHHYTYVRGRCTRANTYSACTIVHPPLM